MFSLGTRARTTKKHPYVMHDQQLEIATETKYLGITIRNNLRWNNHINNIEASANQAQGMALKASHVDAFTVASGSRFHCTTVLGKNEYLK
jgi:hypothetical protein